MVCEQYKSILILFFFDFFNRDVINPLVYDSLTSAGNFRRCEKDESLTREGLLRAFESLREYFCIIYSSPRLVIPNCQGANWCILGLPCEQMYHNYSILIPNGYCHSFKLIFWLSFFIFGYYHHQTVTYVCFCLSVVFSSSPSPFVFIICFDLGFVINYVYPLFMVKPEGKFNVYFANCVSHFDIDCQLMKIME